MGTGSSRTVEVTAKLIDKDISSQVQYDRELHCIERLHNEEIIKLKSQLHEAKDALNKKGKSLEQKSKQLQEEQHKNLSLLFCDLPLQHIHSTDKQPSYSKMCKSYPMVTLAQCDVVGFSSLTASLKPAQAITLIDNIQSIIDESFKDKDIFIMERTTDGCIAASGLVQNDSTTEHLLPRSPSVQDSSSSTTPTNTHFSPSPPPTAAVYASILANGVLKLMSLSTGFRSPGIMQQIQLRIAMHSGPCSAGVVSLQTTVGTQHIPHYKLFGPTVHYTNKLCNTGLALQIRVSKTCWELLNKVNGYQFERCPDYMTWNGQKPLESYWLVGHNELQYSLPTIDQAISLTDYDD